MTMNALLDGGIAQGIDPNEILISLQLGTILLAMTLALLGQQAFLSRHFVASIAVPTLSLGASVTALIGTFSHQPAVLRVLDGALVWSMNPLVLSAWN